MKEDKPPIKQPLQTRSKHTVEAIIEAATRILKKQGETKFNTNFVAEIAGVSVGSLYQFFKNKNAISDELINRLLDKNLKKIEAILKSEVHSNNVDQKIYEVVSSLFDSFEAEGPLTSFVMENVLKIVGLNRFKRIEEKMVPFFLEQIKINNLPFHHSNPELALSNAIQCVRVLVLSYFLSPEKCQREEMILEIKNLLMAYLFKEPN
jgi:AcrR family transcriptional regulator